MKNHRIILNHIPPEDPRIPSASSSILKNFLNHHGAKASIIYWNLKLAELQSLFTWSKNACIMDDSENSLLLYFNYLAIKGNDKRAYINVQAKLLSIKPNYTTSEIAFFDKHMKLYARKLDEALDEYIEEVHSDEILCFLFFIDSKYKWICASIIAEKIKQRYAESIVVIGGINHKDQAISYLQYFNQFDFAIWGEVEKTMFDLCNHLIEENQTYENILRLAFRRDNTITTSSNRKEYNLLTTAQALRPDYSDYFEQKKSLEAFTNHSPVISIETQRKCKNRPISEIIAEVLYFINTYQVYAFRFSDNELAGKDQSLFDQLLDALIPVKEQYPDFSISLAAILPIAINSTVLRKMMMAGFYSIQTDHYLSASENLLEKYGAKSSLANNFLLVKFASLYHLILTETNTIMGIPREADEDILQAIFNLYYLRFSLKDRQFIHRMKTMEVMRHSKYYQHIKGDRSNWDIDALLKKFLPTDYLQLDTKNTNMIGLTPIRTNPLWENFKQAESYFIQNRFEYKLYRKAENAILYKELFNNNVINEFELDAIDWFILEQANSQVISIKFILQEIRNRIKKEFMEIEIINVLENLKSERLIYISCDYKEIVSIINTESII